MIIISFMFYNGPLFSVKSALCIKFMASFLLIPLIIQQELEPLMFKTAISLRFIGIIKDLLMMPMDLSDIAVLNISGSNSCNYC